MAGVPEFPTANDDESLRLITGLEVTHIDWHSFSVSQRINLCGGSAAAAAAAPSAVVVEIPSHGTDCN